VRSLLAHGRLVLAVVAAVAAGCGEQERRVPGTPEPAHVREVERSPYALTCGDLARQPLHPEARSS
jgi:hypothetical protein